MNSQVISVLTETPIKAVIDILLTNNFNGIPVVGKDSAIVGIITKYDLIIKRSAIFDDTKAKDVMNEDPLILFENMTVNDAIKAFSEHHRVDPIPVVDMDKKVIGIISRYDMVKLFREYMGEEVEYRANANPRVDRNTRAYWFMAILLMTVATVIYLINFY